MLTLSYEPLVPGDKATVKQLWGLYRQNGERNGQLGELAAPGRRGFSGAHRSGGSAAACRSALLGARQARLAIQTCLYQAAGCKPFTSTLCLKPHPGPAAWQPDVP